MSHRSIATINRPKPHRYWEDKEAPGTCHRCHLIKRNNVHDPAAAAEQEKAERRTELQAELASSYVDASSARRIREELAADDP